VLSVACPDRSKLKHFPDSLCMAAASDIELP
jgi:hypothetical protein